MQSFGASPAPQRGVALRERVSLGLMCVPFAVVFLFLLCTPAVWSTPLAAFFGRDGEVARFDSGWILATLALLAAALCAWVGILGTRERWKVNRRWQRGLVGSIAATLVTVLLSAWSMTRALDSGVPPHVGFAMFGTMCAMLYGVLCAALSPRDLAPAWHEDVQDEVVD
ncbi:hypothetical protein GCM10009805_17590 [Leucobacter chromiireducens subsp. solipictus]